MGLSRIMFPAMLCISKYSWVLVTQYCASGKIEKIELGGACGAYGGEERCAQGSGGETGGKEPLGRPRHRWEDYIKMVLQEVGGGCGDWMELAQDMDRWRVPKRQGIS